MLTPEGCRSRRERFWSSLPALSRPDWILLHAPRHLTYFANYYQSPFLFRSQNAGAILLLGADGTSLLIADNLLLPFAEAAHVDELESPIWYRSRESAPQRDALLARSAIDAMRARPGNVLGIDSSVPAVIAESMRDERPGLTLINVGPLIHSQMRAKDSDELTILRRSIRAGEAGFAAAIAGIKPGMTELQAFELVNTACMESAGEPVLVYGDFASGPRTEEGGGGPTTRIIEANDLFILDCSVIIHGYRGDCANTFVVDGGSATEKHREMAAVCLDAMAAGEAALRAEARGRDVDAAVRNVIRARGFGDNFQHHTGHGLGLGHPDPPYLVPESEDTLVAGDIVTLEPGIYVAGVGGMRFERNYFITNGGFECLAHHTLGLEPPA